VTSAGAAKVTVSATCGGAGDAPLNVTMSVFVSIVPPALRRP